MVADRRHTWNPGPLPAAAHGTLNAPRWGVGHDHGCRCPDHLRWATSQGLQEEGFMLRDKEDSGFQSACFRPGDFALAVMFILPDPGPPTPKILFDWTNNKQLSYLRPIRRSKGMQN